jgi:hypothetical protein
MKLSGEPCCAFGPEATRSPVEYLALSGLELVTPSCRS